MSGSGALFYTAGVKNACQAAIEQIVQEREQLHLIGARSRLFRITGYLGSDAWRTNNLHRALQQGVVERLLALCEATPEDKVFLTIDDFHLIKAHWGKD